MPPLMDIRNKVNLGQQLSQPSIIVAKLKWDSYQLLLPLFFVPPKQESHRLAVNYQSLVNCQSLMKSLCIVLDSQDLEKL